MNARLTAEVLQVEKDLLDKAHYIVGTGAPAVYLTMADVYIKMYERMPDGKFVLPKNHKDIKLLIEQFAYDLDGFVDFVKDVRDIAAARNDDSYSELQEFYRTVNTRLLQQSRRGRVDKAVECLTKIHGKPEFPVLQEWRRKIEKVWAERRMEFLAERRNRLKSGRLSREEMAELVEKFWALIDAEVERCEVQDILGE